MLKTGWIYLLRREELLPLLQEFSLETAGTVDELRKRMAKFIGGEHKEEVAERLQALQEKFEAGNTLAVPGVSTMNTPGTRSDNQSRTRRASTNNATPNCSAMESKSHLMDQVRRWGLNYNGVSQPLVFVERVEELADIYEVNLDQLPRVMPEFLCERALAWYRNNNGHWETWSTFKRDFLCFFLPHRYFEQLEDQIRERLQRTGECFKDYVLEIQNLMRHSGLTAEQKLQRIYRNTLPKYQWYVRRKDFDSLEELTRMAEDMESIPEIDPVRREAETAAAPRTGPARCHRCGEPGHYANRCPQAEVNPSGNANGGRRN